MKCRLQTTDYGLLNDNLFLNLLYNGLSGSIVVLQAGLFTKKDKIDSLFHCQAIALFK